MGTGMGSQEGHLEGLISPRLQALYTEESFGGSPDAVIFNINDEQIGSTGLGPNPNLMTSFNRLKQLNINPVLEVTVQSQPALQTEGSTPVNSQLNRQTITLIDQQKHLGRTINQQIGSVTINMSDDPTIPASIELSIPENSSPNLTKHPRALDYVRNTLDAAASDKFRSIMETNTNLEPSPLVLDYEKVQLLDQADQLLEESTDFQLAENDREFLLGFRDSIKNGKLDLVLKNAWKDAAISLAATQTLCVAAPILGYLGRNTTGSDQIGASIAAATVIGAPIPSWIYVLAKRGWRPKDEQSFIQFGGSLLSLFLPFGISSAATLPLSLSLQTEDYAKFVRLIHANPKLRASLTQKRRILDQLLLTRFNTDPDVDIKEPAPADRLLQTYFDRNGNGVEVILASTPEDKAQAAQFVAKEYLKHKLSQPGDPDIRNIGTEESPIYEIVDSEQHPGEWLIVRDRKSKEIIVTGKMYKRQPDSLLPMQEELRNQAQNGTSTIEYKAGFDAEQLATIPYEMGRVAFNKNIFGNPNKDMMAGWKYTLTLLSWMRGIYIYMGQKGIDQFGAILSTPANRHLALLGDLGLEGKSDPFYYLPQDKATKMTSSLQVLNLKQATQRVAENNPAVYKFIIENKVNDPNVRRAIWNSIVDRINKANENQPFTAALTNTLRKAVGHLMAVRTTML